MRKVSLDFKNEELIPLTDFVLNSYTTDRAKFILYSPDYGGEHLSTCIDIRDTVDKAINPKTLTVKLKGATSALYSNLDSALKNIDDLERYCEKAKVSLTKKDLEVSSTRKKCHNRDAEGAVKGLKLMQELVAPHLAALEEKGYTKAKQDDLTKLIKDINDNNNLQNSFINQRGELVQNNIELVGQLWDMINDILKTGKIIYKENPAKIKEYTQAKILERIRRERDSPNNGTTGNA